MSEYQYYEFRMVDRSLTREEMIEIRKISTRAEITATSFTNFYTFGDFKGDPVEMMFRWYDAHVYTTNWGTYELMFGFPGGVLDTSETAPYFSSDSLDFHTRGDRGVIVFALNSEDGDWYDEDESDDWLDRLITLRGDIAQRDYRALYLGWLRSVQDEIGIVPYEDEEELDQTWTEPPIPPGLRELTEPLRALVAFLQIDQDLLAVAAERSADLKPFNPSSTELAGWVQALPLNEKEAIIVRLLAGQEMSPRADLLRRFRESTRPAPAAAPPRRTVVELIRAAEERTAERERIEAERAAQAAARKAREEAQARADYLDKLANRQEESWQRVEELIESKTPRSYAEALKLLNDLREVSEQAHKTDDFDERLTSLRNRHAKKTAFQERLDNAGL